MLFKKHVSLIIILVIAFLLRFYNLMHDAPYFFNPDERNMASAITRFALPGQLAQIPSCLITEFFNVIKKAETPGCNLNPHFFAYGQFPLYLSYASDQLTEAVKHLLSGITNTPTVLKTDFPQAVLWLRFWSALFSVAAVLIVYIISRLLLNSYFALLASLFTAFSPGLIQSAHFGTTESLLAFFFLAIICLSILLYRYLDVKKVVFSFEILAVLFYISLALGLSLGSKLTAVTFYFPPLFTLVLSFLKPGRIKIKKIAPRLIFIYSSFVFMLLSLSVLIFIISSPYNLVEPRDFKSAVFGYESDVALGKYEAFYTRQFVNTLPIVFQMEKVFPYVLGWPVFILGSIGFLLMNLHLFIKVILAILSKIKNSKFKTKSSKINYIWILLFGFWIYFLPNVILFAKWTRFMTPVLPFFAIFSVYLLFIISKTLTGNKIYLLFVFCFSFFSVASGLAFMSIYKRPDSRVTASEWIYENIPSSSYVLSETANVVDIPLGLPGFKHPEENYNLTVISFDFYHLQERPELYNQLLNHLEKADYIFIPSRRIFKNYPRLPVTYKTVTKYYQFLFSGALGYEKVAEISSFPSLSLGPWQINFPDEDAEETFTVFDHPVIRIYKKVTPMTFSGYHDLFTGQIPAISNTP